MICMSLSLDRDFRRWAPCHVCHAQFRRESGQLLFPVTQCTDRRDNQHGFAQPAAFDLHPMCAIVCTVLPKPMSSARIPPSRNRRKTAASPAPPVGNGARCRGSSAAPAAPCARKAAQIIDQGRQRRILRAQDRAVQINSELPPAGRPAADGSDRPARRSGLPVEKLYQGVGDPLMRSTSIGR